MDNRRRMEILYEDDYLIVVDKPCGLLSMSTGKEGEVTAYSILTDYVRHGRKGHREKHRERIFIVHRLDRDTSGVMIFAKDPDTKYTLQDGWNESVLERKYVAVLEGIPPEESGTITSWLTYNDKTMRVHSCPYDNGGRKAVTFYDVLDTSRDGHWSLVEFELETGRKNQIRVHAAEMGNHIAGDRKYGALTNPLHRLALHARSIVFIHPVSGETMDFDIGIPSSFTKLFG